MRLEMLGFQAIFDYVAAKADWLAHNLPTEGTDSGAERAGKHLRTDVATCGPDDDVGATTSGNRGIIVVDERRIVLGRIRPNPGLPDVPAETVMEPGPTTIRAHEPLEPLLARMEQRNVDEVIVTTPDGELIGVVYRDAST